ncbi:MAG: hypothetical protein QGH54_03690 [SAR202 cluster bacterium]|nr:hypothetical protein [SAR202 cluster bacterium]
MRIAFELEAHEHYYDCHKRTSMLGVHAVMLVNQIPSNLEDDARSVAQVRPSI